MSYKKMYGHPVINKPVPTSELNLPIGSKKGFMYRLPKIQGIFNDSEPDILKQLEARQADILKQLEALRIRVDALKGHSETATTDRLSFLDIVIHSCYHTPPYSLAIACRLLQEQSGLRIFTSSHVHSSVKTSLQHLEDFLPSSNCQSRGAANVRITIIWKESIGRDPQCFVGMLANKKITGEVNLLRFLNRQFGLLCVSDHLKSSNNDAKSDEWLDCIHSSIIWGSSDKFQLFLKDIAQVISKQEFLQPAKEPGLVDLAAYSSIKQNQVSKSHPGVIQKYINACQSHFEPSGPKATPPYIGLV